MDQYFTVIVVVGVVGFLSLLMWAAQRGRPAVDLETGTLQFRHSGLFRGFSYFFAFGVPLGITALVIFNPPKNENEIGIVVGLYGFFALLSAPLLWESLRFSLTVSAEGLDCQSPWRGRHFFAWNEVEEVKFSSVNSWFIIRGKDGWKFRVSILVPGLARFLEECEERLPPTALRNARDGYTRVGRPFPETPRKDEPPPWEKWKRGEPGA